MWKANGRSRILSKWDTQCIFPNIFELWTSCRFVGHDLNPRETDSWRPSDTWSARSPTAPKRPGKGRTTSYFAHNTTKYSMTMVGARLQKTWSYVKLHGVQNSAAKRTRTLPCPKESCGTCPADNELIGNNGCKSQLKLPLLPHPFCNIFPRNWQMVARWCRLRVISRIGDIPWTAVFAVWSCILI